MESEIRKGRDDDDDDAVMKASDSDKNKKWEFSVHTKEV